MQSARCLLALLLLTLPACAASTDDASAPDQTENDLTSLTGAFWIEPQSAAPNDDTLFAIEFEGGKKVRALFGYKGETYIKKACVGTFAFGGKGQSRTLDVTCPSDVQPTSYPIVSVAADAVVLSTPKHGTQYTLRTTRGIKGSPHLTCTSAKFSATLDVVGTGNARRVFLTTKAITPPAGATNGALFNVPYDGSLWIESNGKGLDLRDNEYVLSLPQSLTGHVTAKLTYTDELQFYPTPASYQLSCDPS